MSSRLRELARYGPGNTLRFLVIGFIAFVAGLLYLLARLAALAVWPSARRYVWLARFRGRILRVTMTILGATFVKLGQVMSTRPDLFPPETIDELRKLQDRVPPFSFRKVRQILALDLGPDPESRFAELDPVPIAAASVAQVHRGRLADGTEVAVKVLRPDVRRKAKRDGRILRACGWMLELHPTLRLSEPRAHIEAFIEGIVSQTDLRGEAANYERFRREFADEPLLVMPRTYSGLSGEHCLTMDFIHGTKVDGLPAGRNHQHVAKLIRRVFFRMAFEHGFVHADLHPGNLLVMGDGRVAMLDVGLVNDITPALLEQFIDFNRCLSTGTPADFIVHLKRYHKYMGEVDWDRIQADSGELIGRFRGKRLAEIETSVFINQLLALGRRHRVRPMPELTLVLVGFVTSEGIGKQLDPDADTFNEMAKILMPIVAKRAMAAQAAAKSAKSASASA